MKKCPSCGWSCPDSTVRCVKCKCSLVGVASTLPEGQAARVKERRTSAPPWLVVAIIVSVIFIICMIVVGYQNNDAAPTAQPAASSRASSLPASSAAVSSEIESSEVIAPAPTKEEYIAACSEYSYEEVARDPSKYEGSQAKFKGKVVQVLEHNLTVGLRINVTNVDGRWSDTIMVNYIKKSADESRILDNDIVMVYGAMGGLYRYVSTLNKEVAIPLCNAEYVDLIK